MNVTFMPEKKKSIRFLLKGRWFYTGLARKDLEMNYVEAPCALLMKILV